MQVDKTLCSQKRQGAFIRTWAFIMIHTIFMTECSYQFIIKMQSFFSINKQSISDKLYSSGGYYAHVAVSPGDRSLRRN